MRTRSILGIIVAVIMIYNLSDLAFAGRGGPQGNQTGVTESVSLSESEAATLAFMREEEKLARDVYLVFATEWGVNTFVNIAASEQKHMDAIKRLLDKYGLVDPAFQEIGLFNDAELQDLYDELIPMGQVSELEALMVGALIEEVDIEDLQMAIDQTDKPDIKRVYGNLLRGSENHLRAFVSNIEALGVTYVAQLLDQEVVDGILAEEGSGMKRNRTNRR